jgi:hypothetical protein
VVEELSADGNASNNTTCLTGRFTMATRNAATGTSQRIAPLQLEGEEKELFQMGEGAFFSFVATPPPPTLGAPLLACITAGTTD